MGRVSDSKQRLMEAVTELIWRGSYGTTTIDQICAAAEVKKGSFYYFFESKSALAAAAIDARWQLRKPQLDSTFSATVPPLERLVRFGEACYSEQTRLKEECGCVLGCPLFSLGSEVCNKEKILQSKINEILTSYHRYIESAIRDAHALGLIHAPDAAAKARIVFAYCEGLLTQARILNDTGGLREMQFGILEILGIHQGVTASGKPSGAALALPAAIA